MVMLSVRVDPLLNDLSNHFFESLKCQLQRHFGLKSEVVLCNTDGMILTSFENIDPNKKFFIVKQSDIKWPEKVVVVKRKQAKITKLKIPRLPHKIQRYTSFFRRTNYSSIKQKQEIIPGDLTPEEICERYNLDFGQFLYLSSRFDSQLKNSNRADTIPLEWLLAHRGDIFRSLQIEIAKKICFAKEIAGYVNRSQYIWLYSLLGYNSIPLEEIVYVWNVIFNPKNVQVVPSFELKEVLDDLYKSCKGFDLEFSYSCFAKVMLEELEETDCLTAEGNLIISNFKVALTNETKLLLYLNQMITRNSNLDIPLPSLWMKIGLSLERKYKFTEKLLEVVL